MRALTQRLQSHAGAIRKEIKKHALLNLSPTDEVIKRVDGDVAEWSKALPC